MKVKKLMALLLSVTVMGTILAGCGNSAKSSDTGNMKTEGSTGSTVSAGGADPELVELNFIFADGDEGAKSSMNQIVQDFNDSHDNIKVNIVPGNGGTYSEFLKTKDSVGEFPDVMEMRDTAIYVRAGKLAELPEDITSLFTSTTKFDGKVYTAPLGGENTDGIIYNKKYFDDNGLEEPATYDEFMKLCQTIKDKGDMSPLVVGGQDLFHMGFWFFKAYNDQVLLQDPDFIKNCYAGTKDFSDPTIAATFSELKDIFQYAQDGWISTPDAQITTFLVSNMSAMMYSGTHMFSQIEQADPNFEYGWFPVPSPDGKVRLVGGSGIGGLSVSAEAAADPNKKAAAEEFIKFFFTPDEYKIYCEKLSAIPLTVNKPQLDINSVFQEVIDAQGTADLLSPMWNGFAGDNELPPDFRNFMYKTVIEYLAGEREMDSCAAELNNTWKSSVASFNPLTGTGMN
ncbi:MAG: ABC transporter substrate-binding protein [Anaerocolumna sp.]